MTPIIGVFDSGFGGLTVLRALIDRFPHARFAFLGDTARLPYGSKSRRTIARYAAQSAQFLVREQGAEFLVIACNTASALALDAIQDAVTVPVLGVIEPGASAARAASKTGDVLVIATDATVQSHAYAAACQAQGLRALEKACPLLVPLVEEGWTDHPVTAEVIQIYLAELNTDAAIAGLNPDTLLLGCTHYPLLRPLLERAVPAGVQVIDSAEAAAEAAVQLFNNRAAVSQAAVNPRLAAADSSPVASDSSPVASDSSPVASDLGFVTRHDFSRAIETAKSHRALAPAASSSGEAQIRCFATDSVEKFERLGSRFLGRPVGNVELVDLGG